MEGTGLDSGDSQCSVRQPWRMKAARFSAARLAFSFSWPVASARSDVAGWQPCISKEEVRTAGTSPAARETRISLWIPGRLLSYLFSSQNPERQQPGTGAASTMGSFLSRPSGNSIWGSRRYYLGPHEVPNLKDLATFYNVSAESIARRNDLLNLPSYQGKQYVNIPYRDDAEEKADKPMDNWTMQVLFSSLSRPAPYQCCLRIFSLCSQGLGFSSRMPSSTKTH